MEIWDHESQNIFAPWLKAFEASLGHIGKSRRSIERGNRKMMKGFPLFINLYSVWMDSISDFTYLSLEAMKRMNNKTAFIKESMVFPTGHESKESIK